MKTKQTKNYKIKIFVFCLPPKLQSRLYPPEMLYHLIEFFYGPISPFYSANTRLILEEIRRRSNIWVELASALSINILFTGLKCQTKCCSMLCDANVNVYTGTWTKSPMGWKCAPFVGNSGEPHLMHNTGHIHVLCDVYVIFKKFVSCLHTAERAGSIRIRQLPASRINSVKKRNINIY